jgi:hypothetical protein
VSRRSSLTVYRSADTVEFWSHHEVRLCTHADETPLTTSVFRKFVLLRDSDGPLQPDILCIQVVVVDNHRACIGGLDLCFGRFDTHTHPLADAHPTEFSRTLFPGQGNAYVSCDLTHFKHNCFQITTMPGSWTSRMCLIMSVTQYLLWIRRECHGTM